MHSTRDMEKQEAEDKQSPTSPDYNVARIVAGMFVASTAMFGIYSAVKTVVDINGPTDMDMEEVQEMRRLMQAGPPPFVTNACDAWCEVANSDSPEIEDGYTLADYQAACDRCENGYETNPECVEGGSLYPCDYCTEHIAFERSWPQLWIDDTMRRWQVDTLVGKTRCWCDTNCPKFKLRSRRQCASECREICRDR